MFGWLLRGSYFDDGLLDQGAGGVEERELVAAGVVGPLEAVG